MLWPNNRFMNKVVVNNQWKHEKTLRTRLTRWKNKVID